MPDVEAWRYRAKCGCGAVIWIDRSQRVACVCAKSAIEPDGTLTGSASSVTDEEMVAFIDSDHGRIVALEQV